VMKLFIQLFHFRWREVVQLTVPVALIPVIEPAMPSDPGIGNFLKSEALMPGQAWSIRQHGVAHKMSFLHSAQTADHVIRQYCRPTLAELHGTNKDAVKQGMPPARLYQRRRNDLSLDLGENRNPRPLPPHVPKEPLDVFGSPFAKPDR